MYRYKLNVGEKGTPPTLKGCNFCYWNLPFCLEIWHKTEMLINVQSEKNITRIVPQISCFNVFIFWFKYHQFYYHNFSRTRLNMRKICSSNLRIIIFSPAFINICVFGAVPSNNKGNWWLVLTTQKVHTNIFFAQQVNSLLNKEEKIPQLRCKSLCHMGAF